MSCETTSTTIIPFGEGSVTVTHTTRNVTEKIGLIDFHFMDVEEVKVSVEIHGYSLPTSLPDAIARMYWEAYKKGKEDAENER